MPSEIDIKMKISVWITSYNQKSYLKEAIESVLAQTLKPYQIIIVDDFSSDGSQELIYHYVSEFPCLITPVFHQQNTGIAQVRIDALKSVKGDFVTYLDGDDLYLPKKLELEAMTMKQNPSVDLVYSNYQFFDAETNKNKYKWVEEKLPPEGYVFSDVFTRNFPNRIIFKMELVRYNAWKKIGFHDNQLKIFEDYEMRIRLAKHLQVKYNPYCLSKIRLHSGGLSYSPIETYIDCMKYIYQKNLFLMSDLTQNEKKIFARNLITYINPMYRQYIKKKIRNLQFYELFAFFSYYLNFRFKLKLQCT